VLGGIAVAPGLALAGAHGEAPAVASTTSCGGQSGLRLALAEDAGMLISLPLGVPPRPTPLFTTNVGEPIVGPRGHP